MAKGPPSERLDIGPFLKRGTPASFVIVGRPSENRVVKNLDRLVEGFKMDGLIRWANAS